MKVVNQTLLAALLGSALLTACGQKEEPKVETAATVAAPAPEVKKEPVKEEPGGWEPPPELRVPGITIPAEGAAPATPEAAAPAPAAGAAPAAAPAAAEKPAK